MTCSRSDGGSVGNGGVATPDIGMVSEHLLHQDVLEARDKSNTYLSIDARTSRLIDWIVTCMEEMLCTMIARRESIAMATVSSTRKGTKRQGQQERAAAGTMPALQPGATYLDEVKEIITLPEFKSTTSRKEKKTDNTVIPPIAVEQLRNYVTCIAKMYRYVPYKTKVRCTNTKTHTFTSYPSTFLFFLILSYCNCIMQGKTLSITLNMLLML